MPKQKPVKILTLDTETYGFEGGLKRIAVYDGDRVYYGYEFEDIEPILSSYFYEGFSVHCYIHNIEFDARKIPEIFDRDRINWNQTKLVNGKYTTIACKYYTFHDSARLLGFSSLASLSKDFEVTHAKMDLATAVRERDGNIWDDLEGEFDAGRYFCECDKDDPIYIEYLGYDVISLYEVLYKVMELTGVEENDFVSKMSTASLAKHIFKKGFRGKIFITEGQDKTDYEMMTKFKGWAGKKPTKSGHTYEELENMLRLAYCGGRTEVFKPRLDGHGFHYDINSMYPYAMLNEFPIGTPKYFSGKSAHAQFYYWMRNKKGLGFIHAKVYIPDQPIPPLPVKIGKLVFPTGYVEGWFTYIEMEYAVKNCGVKIESIEECILFTQTFPVFMNLINTLYEIKEHATVNKQPALRTIAKLLMNVSYGYTALRRDDKDELKDISQLEKYYDRLLFKNEELGFIDIRSIVLTDSIQVQIASYVTSYARIHLLDSMRKASEYCTVYYCDTDSMVLDGELPPEMVHGSKLGMWDLEKEISYGLFIQPKVYYETPINGGKETLKFKGVTKATKNTFDRDFYEYLYNMLAEGKEERFKVESHKRVMRGIKYQQKQAINGEIDWNGIEYRDKELNLKNKQKRDIDYINNMSYSWHMDSFEEFHNFDFKEKPIRLTSENPSLFNMLVM